MKYSKLQANPFIIEEDELLIKDLIYENIDFHNYNVKIPNYKLFLERDYLVVFQIIK
jgi:hypothetical protein